MYHNEVGASRVAVRELAEALQSPRVAEQRLSSLGAVIMTLVPVIGI